MRTPNKMNDSLTELSLSAIAAFSASVRLHRAFGHLVAAAAGSLLCVPLPLAAGDLRAVVDGCPVPWEEVWALLSGRPEALRLTHASGIRFAQV